MKELIRKYIWVFLISMLPIVELRGAIPIGIGNGLPLIPTYLVSVLGNILPVPFLILFSRTVLKWCAKLPKIGPFFQKIIDKAIEKSQSEQFKKGEFLALYLFVSIPLPGTGAWTGSLIAAILQMDWKKAFLIISCGVVTAGIIMILLSVFVGGAVGAAFGIGDLSNFSLF